MNGWHDDLNDTPEYPAWALLPNHRDLGMVFRHASVHALTYWKVIYLNSFASTDLFSSCLALVLAAAPGIVPHLLLLTLNSLTTVSFSSLPRKYPTVQRSRSCESNSASGIVWIKWFIDRWVVVILIKLGVCTAVNGKYFCLFLLGHTPFTAAFRCFGEMSSLATCTDFLNGNLNEEKICQFVCISGA